MQNFSLSLGEVKENIRDIGIQTSPGYVEVMQSLCRKYGKFRKPFYIHSFYKTQGGIIYHHGRFTKPFPSPGASLQRIVPPDLETSTIMWTLPNEEAFKLYMQGKFLENEFVHSCVIAYLEDVESMMQPEPGDAPEEEIKEIYISMKEGGLREQSDRVHEFMRSAYIPEIEKERAFRHSKKLINLP